MENYSIKPEEFNFLRNLNASIGNKQFDIMIMQKTDYDFKNGLLIQNKVDVSKYEFDNVGFDENKQPYFTVKEIKGGSNASTE